MSREPWEPTVRDVVRVLLYLDDRWLFDCSVCGHALHDGLCTRKVWAQPQGISL